MLIIHNQNGVEAGKIVKSKDSVLDDGHTGICAGSTFERFNDKGESTKVPKNTDDKIVLGYTTDGLPFQIVVDGFLGGETNNIFKFIDEHVVGLIEAYNDNLKHSEHPEEVTRDLIKQIYRLRKMYAPGCDFTLSMAVSYEKNGEMLCSGFGIGDTGIVLKRLSGEIEQLVHHTEVDGFKDAFEAFTENKFDLDHVIDRNSIFTTAVSPGDEIVGYTWVHDNLEHTTDEFEDVHTYNEKNTSVSVKKKKLNIEMEPNDSLFEMLLARNAEEHTKKIAETISNGKSAQFGDDATFGKMIIPNESLQHNLKQQQSSFSLLAFALSRPMLTSLAVGVFIGLCVAAIVASCGAAALIGGSIGLAGLAAVAVGSAISGVTAGGVSSAITFFACNTIDDKPEHIEANLSQIP